MAFDTILFDLDGTLTDSGPGIMNGVEYAVREMGLAPRPKEFYRRFIGPPLQWSFRHYCGLDEAGARRAVETYRVYYSDKGIWENAPYPGIPDLLAALQAAGAALMVATSKPEVMAVQVLERFGLMPFLTCVAGASLDEAADQKAAAVRRCLEQGRGTAVMVGDRSYDIKGAHANHIPAIGVLYGYGSREEFEDAGAECIAESVSDLQQILLHGTLTNTKE